MAAANDSRRRRGQCGSTGRHVLGRRRGRGHPVLVRGPGDGCRGGRRPGRRGRARWAAADHHSRNASNTAPPLPTSRARTARFATARASSWGTGATTTVRSRRGSLSAMDSATRRSPSVSPRFPLPSTGREQSITVSLPVTNTGSRAGSEVVQCYVAPESARLVDAAQGTQGVRQGLARGWGEHGGRSRARVPRLRLLGPGPGRLV